jgi:hypothetical protein
MIGTRMEVATGMRSVPLGLTRSMKVSVTNPEAFEVAVVRLS